MTDSRLFDDLYAPVLAEIEQRARVGDRCLDKDVYRIYLATLWANAVLEPGRAGLEADNLEAFYDYLNARSRTLLGGEEPVLDCFRYLIGKQGGPAMERAHVPADHRAQLLRFAGLMGLARPDRQRDWTGP